MTEKQRKALVEFIKNPKNDKTTLGEAWNPRWGEPNIPSTRNDRSGRGNKCLEIDLSKIEDQLKGKLSEEHLDKLFNLEQDGKRIELQAEWSWYDEPSVNASGEEPEGSVEIVDEDDWRSYLMQEGFSEEEIDTLFETILDYYENAEDEDWEWETAYYDRKRAKRGNWKGSVGKFSVEENSTSVNKTYSNSYKNQVLRAALKIHPDMVSDKEELEAILNLRPGYDREPSFLTGNLHADAVELLAVCYNIEPGDSKRYRELGLKESSKSKNDKFYDDWFNNLPKEQQWEIINDYVKEWFLQCGGIINNAGDWIFDGMEDDPFGWWYEADIDLKDEAYQDLKNLKEHKHSNRMGKFDYKEYLAHNWLLQEAQAPVTAEAEDWLTEPVDWFACYCKILEEKEGNCRRVVLSVLQAYGIPESILEDATERVVEEILEPEEGDTYSPYESDETVSEWLEGLFDDDSWWNEN